MVFADTFAASTKKQRKMDNSSIKENIRRARLMCKMTQEELADILGISLTAYRDLEKGPTAIINANITKIADATGSTVEEIMLGFRPMPSDGRLEEVQAEYGRHESILQTRISDLERLVCSLKDTIACKDEIITMLKKNIDEKR